MDIRQHLRTATQAAHERLETTLDLLSVPLSRDKFTRILSRFWGFHTVWEREMARHETLRGLMQGRGRLQALEADLTALGLTTAEIAALPICGAAAALAASQEQAVGTLYVIEGSTLGGQMISKALVQADWAPPGGLRYFNPYGAETGAMWRRFQEALSAASSPQADPHIIAGAQGTFSLLEHWLGRATA